MSSSNVTQGHLVKIECSVADVTAVGSLDRAERAFLGVIVAGRVLSQSRSYFARFLYVVPMLLIFHLY